MSPQQQAAAAGAAAAEAAFVGGISATQQAAAAGAAAAQAAASLEMTASEQAAAAGAAAASVGRTSGMTLQQQASAAAAAAASAGAGAGLSADAQLSAGAAAAGAAAALASAAVGQTAAQQAEAAGGAAAAAAASFNMTASQQAAVAGLAAQSAGFIAGMPAAEQVGAAVKAARDAGAAAGMPPAQLAAAGGAAAGQASHAAGMNGTQQAAAVDAAAVVVMPENSNNGSSESTSSSNSTSDRSSSRNNETNASLESSDSNGISLDSSSVGSISNYSSSDIGNANNSSDHNINSSNPNSLPSSTNNIGGKSSSNNMLNSTGSSSSSSSITGNSSNSGNTGTNNYDSSDNGNDTSNNDGNVSNNSSINTSITHNDSSRNRSNDSTDRSSSTHATGIENSSSGNSHRTDDSIYDNRNSSNSSNSSNRGTSNITCSSGLLLEGSECVGSCSNSASILILSTAEQEFLTCAHSAMAPSHTVQLSFQLDFSNPPPNFGLRILRGLSAALGEPGARLGLERLTSGSIIAHIAVLRLQGELASWAEEVAGRLEALATSPTQELFQQDDIFSSLSGVVGASQAVSANGTLLQSAAAPGVGINQPPAQHEAMGTSAPLFLGGASALPVVLGSLGIWCWYMRRRRKHLQEHSVGFQNLLPGEGSAMKQMGVGRSLEHDKIQDAWLDAARDDGTGTPDTSGSQQRDRISSVKDDGSQGSSAYSDAEDVMANHADSGATLQNSILQHQVPDGNLGLSLELLEESEAVQFSESTLISNGSLPGSSSNVEHTSTLHEQARHVAAIDIPFAIAFAAAWPENAQSDAKDDLDHSAASKAEPQSPRRQHGDTINSFKNTIACAVAWPEDAHPNAKYSPGNSAASNTEPRSPRLHDGHTVNSVMDTVTHPVAWPEDNHPDARDNASICADSKAGTQRLERCCGDRINSSQVLCEPSATYETPPHVSERPFSANGSVSGALSHTARAAARQTTTTVQFEIPVSPSVDWQGVNAAAVAGPGPEDASIPLESSLALGDVCESQQARMELPGAAADSPREGGSPCSSAYLDTKHDTGNRSNAESKPQSSPPQGEDDQVSVVSSLWLPEDPEELAALFGVDKTEPCPEVAVPPVRGHAPWTLEPWSPQAFPEDRTEFHSSEALARSSVASLLM
eukprot:TRINITY_DN4946_c0_g1_i1.p1 TRINITY_DN4946_c0_g1~~TRINITY_DN4946_c0_g1_i1.p1  ORF type:complete len:1213 (-),score=328.74 TRINITY_DN4946_c0_g1_i1:107-3553(-)